MSDYGKLLSRIWADKEFTALAMREQQLFMLLLSYPTRNLAGVLPLTLRRWAGAAADATPDSVRAALQILLDKRFICIDWDTEEVGLRTFIRNDEIWKQPNVMVACLKDCRRVASAELRAVIADELLKITGLMPVDTAPRQKIHYEVAVTAKTLVETPNEPLPEPFAEPLPEPLGEPPVVVTVSTVGNTPTPTTATAPSPSPAVTHLSGNQPLVGGSGGKTSADAHSASAKPPAKRATQISDDYMPPPRSVDLLREDYPQVSDDQLRYQHKKFLDHWRKTGKPMRDWDATWRNWMRTAGERGEFAASVGQVNGARVTRTDARILELQARNAADRSAAQPLSAQTRLELS